MVATGKARFGRVRKLPSGRWQARYHGPDGIDRPAPATFATVTDARVWLSTVEADLVRGKWIDPAGGRVQLAAYAERWMANRPDLSNRTREKYAGLLKVHILPAFGHREMSVIEPVAVRGWWAKLAQTHPSTAASAYRLLSTIYRTAIADGQVARSPCQVRGGGVEHAPERPVATVAEVGALADAMPDRLRAAVLLAGWCGLRRGEILALRRRDLRLLQRTVEVRQAAEYLADGTVGYKAPKTAAGRRRVAIPAHIVDDLAGHLAAYVDGDPDALVFTGAKGGPLRPHVLANHWRAATEAVGLAGFHFHDLRHTSNTWAAATGASTRELMARMGHASPVAAIGYQPATADRDRVIADALAALAANSAPSRVVSIDEAKR